MRARRCAFSRKYSIDILFFCSGYSSGGHTPRQVNFSRVTSTACPEAGDGTRSPSARTEAPVFSFLSSASIESAFALSDGLLRSKVSWIFAKQLPSLTCMKTRFLESRTVRTQPHTVMFFPSGSETRMSLISVGTIHFLHLI